MSKQKILSSAVNSVEYNSWKLYRRTGKFLDSTNLMPSIAGDSPFSALLCVVFCLSLFPIALSLTSRHVPTANGRFRLMFLWHAYDALTHLIIEGSFLYECFFSYANAYGRHPPHFLGDKGRIYGAAFGRWPSARLWQEYAKADHRWATAEPTVVSIELLTVLFGGPAAVYACYQLRLMYSRQLKDNASMGRALGKFWIVATILATAELYGGFMTFVPEFLTGCPQLETGNWVYLLVYLIFFNGLWVVAPALVLREASKEIPSAFVALNGQRGRK